MFSLDTATFALILLVYIHVTGVVFSIYSHRHLSHGLVDYHPIIKTLMRFWLWLTIGVQSNAKTASHRQHHQFTDRIGDPHSVHVDGFYKLGVERLLSTYKILALFGRPVFTKSDDYPKKYGVYHRADYTTRYPRSGRACFLIANTAMFGTAGLLLFFVFYLLVIVFLMLVIDVGCHSIGYRSYQTKDKSYNLPFMFGLVGGEEYHHNHHAKPNKIKYSHKWHEFDVGYFYIFILQKLGLAIKI